MVAHARGSEVVPICPKGKGKLIRQSVKSTHRTYISKFNMAASSWPVGLVQGPSAGNAIHRNLTKAVRVLRGQLFD